MESIAELTWMKVGRKEDFPERIGKEVQIGGLDLAVFQLSDGRIFALENRTAHRKGGPLAEGIVSGEFVYCPLRDLKISLITGDVQAPDEGHIPTYPVRINDATVEIGV